MGSAASVVQLPDLGSASLRKPTTFLVVQDALKEFRLLLVRQVNE